MIRFVRHPLTLAVLAIGALYAIFGHAIQPPLPRSLLIQYMLFSSIGVFMVASFNNRVFKQLLAPIRTLLGAPRLKHWRSLAMVVVVIGGAAVAYEGLRPTTESPIELRSVHPAPPSALRVFGKTFDLAKLENPLRASASKGSEEYEAHVEVGREAYYKNCVYCHGDQLDGRGHFAAGFNPRPANFQDIGTIAQLQESYVFWRIATGGPGLPREGAPWASAMPVWHEMLTETEIWQVILFLYDYTGHEPRSWELEGESEAASGRTVVSESSAEEPDNGDNAAITDGDAIQVLYENRCAQCHGLEGDGQGPAAPFLFPKPRDFTLGTFKYKSTEADAEFPSDEDLLRTIRQGLPGTSMPAWRGILSDAQIDGLIQLIKVFGFWEEEEGPFPPIDEGTQVASSGESVARGEKLFVKACVQCHGEFGRGNVTSGKKLKDDSGDRIWPRNLTRPDTWRATTDARTIFQRISTGIRGTPMPEHTTTMPIQDRWDIANYVMTLRQRATPMTEGETVIRGVRLDGALPTDPNDAVWQTAPSLTLPLVPNIIKEQRLFFTFNDAVTVRALFNDEAIALRVDVDDRTYSLPGNELEQRYAAENLDATADALAVQLPATLPKRSEKPWFRHGDSSHPVNMWYWRAQGDTPQSAAEVRLFDAAGPDVAPVAREGIGELNATGRWQKGQWRVVFQRPLATDDVRDLQLEAGSYIPIAFANWDGWSGQDGAQHTLTSWYWLLLEEEAQPALIYGISGASGVAAGLIFFGLARRERRRVLGSVTDA